MPEIDLNGLQGRCQGHGAGTAAKSPAGEGPATGYNPEVAGGGRLLFLPLS